MKQSMTFNLAGLEPRLSTNEEQLTLQMPVFEPRGPILHEDVVDDIVKQLNISERDVENAVDDFFAHINIIAFSKLLHKRIVYR